MHKRRRDPQTPLKEPKGAVVQRLGSRPPIYPNSAPRTVAPPALPHSPSFLLLPLHAGLQQSASRRSLAAISHWLNVLIGKLCFTRSSAPRSFICPSFANSGSAKGGEQSSARPRLRFAQKALWIRAIPLSPWPSQFCILHRQQRHFAVCDPPRQIRPRIVLQSILALYDHPIGI
ncbi:hypothetical protein N657DRAFT_29346 [Parathielavia appendiculata]|uniref:Uncharacterized protein n=1 Tax=Parathielavia appendiculata TaxID=2587402 RepID=A0AAN6Z863_9PEZI|nr:hypothetical protein N657DRAFT_29346 [Parathielavia appendiculata]